MTGMPLTKNDFITNLTVYSNSHSYYYFVLIYRIRFVVHETFDVVLSLLRSIIDMILIEIVLMDRTVSVLDALEI